MAELDSGVVANFRTAYIIYFFLEKVIINVSAIAGPASSLPPAARSRELTASDAAVQLCLAIERNGYEPPGQMQPEWQVDES